MFPSSCEGHERRPSAVDGGDLAGEVGGQPFHPQDLGIGRLFERVRDAVIVADAHSGRIVLWNPAATEIFG